MKKEFELLEHTADVGIIAYGADMKETFANAARALFSLMAAELDNVGETLHWDTELTAPDRESLLVAWLNELIFLFDTEQIIFKRFDIRELSETYLNARSYGEKVDSSRHKLKMGVKAATYHMLNIEQNDGAKARVIFDI